MEELSDNTSTSNIFAQKNSTSIFTMRLLNLLSQKNAKNMMSRAVFNQKKDEGIQ